jgi:NADH-quinone oxidoreductase subunit N
MLQNDLNVEYSVGALLKKTIALCESVQDYVTRDLLMTLLDDFKGLNQRSPWYAFLMLITMFSMAGLPPTVGFYAKLSVLQAVFAAGYAWLAVTAVLLSLIGAFYYLRVVKLMYFDAPQDTARIAAQPDMRLLLSVNGLSMLVLGVLPQPLMAICIASIQYSL